MTFLPIIGRELRVRARGRALYWTRFAVALAGVLICVQALESGVVAPGLIGRFVFDSVVAAAFLVSCSACLLTADAISGERRDGNLDLLLLTRVRGMDVLLGKLGSIGFASVCALAAFVPSLVIPIWAGGVTGGDAFRKGLALFDTLILALGIGLWASAAHHDRFKAARAALVMICLSLVVPYVLFRTFAHGVLHWIGVLSPLSLVASAGDLAYAAAPAFYWCSFGAVQLLAWWMVMDARTRLQRSVREEIGPVLARWRRLRVWLSGGQTEERSRDSHQAPSLDCEGAEASSGEQVESEGRRLISTHKIMC